jgi:hypothetical protein
MSEIRERFDSWDGINLEEVIDSAAYLAANNIISY